MAEFKIVLLGEGCVGKTSLVTRYVRNEFRENHVATVQASFLQKRIHLWGERVQLNIWDTAGQETYHSLGPIYYRDAHGAVLVYDLTEPESYQRIQDWVRELRAVLGPIPMILVGNKCDLVRRPLTPPTATARSSATAKAAKDTPVQPRAIGQEVANAYAKQLSTKMPTIALPQAATSSSSTPSPSPRAELEMVLAMDASAKQNENVDLVFLELAKRMLALRKAAPSTSSSRAAVLLGSPSPTRQQRSSVVSLGTKSSPRRSQRSLKVGEQDLPSPPSTGIAGEQSGSSTTCCTIT